MDSGILEGGGDFLFSYLRFLDKQIPEQTFYFGFSFCVVAA
jgi:hypothetical protein